MISLRSSSDSMNLGGENRTGSLNGKGCSWHVRTNSNTIQTDTICQNVDSRPTKKHTHPDIILPHGFLGKSISSLQKSILDSDLITGVPLLLQPQLPSKALKAFCSNKCSALQSYGLATITPWGAIYSGALDWIQRGFLLPPFRSRTSSPQLPKGREEDTAASQ